VSRGLSRMQRDILDYLSGAKKVARWPARGGPCETADLVDALWKFGYFQSCSQRQATFTARRACLSLFRRGLVRGWHTKGDRRPFQWTILWDLTSAPIPRVWRTDRPLTLPG
jgi:hypothetical protein